MTIDKGDLDLYKIRDEIRVKVNEALVKDAHDFINKITVYNNWASKIGHPCVRCLCYNRTHWREQIIPPVDKLKMFKVGRPLEAIVEEEMKKAGYNIYQKKTSELWREHQIGMMVDRWLEIKKVTIPCEIKSMSPNAYPTVESIDDFLNHDRWYMRQYPAQLLAYCWKNNIQYGFMIPFHKINGDWKMIPFYAFDKTCLEVMELTLQKVAKVNKYVKEFEIMKDKKLVDAILPKRINNLDICIECQYRNICKPIIEMKKDAKKIPVPDNFTEEIQRWLETKPIAKEYAKLDKHIKGYFKGIELTENVIIGDKYLVTASKRHQKESITKREEKDYYVYGIKEIEEKKDVIIHASVISGTGSAKQGKKK